MGFGVPIAIEDAGAFTVVKRQGEWGSKTCEMHVSQPMNIERVLGTGY